MATLSFGTSTDNFTRLVNSTTAHFFKKEEQNILLKRRFPALLQAGGRVTKRVHGDELKWSVRYKRTTPVVIGDVVNLNFPRQNKKKVAVLPWAGYAVTDAVGEKEKMLNQSPEAILHTTAEVMKDLKDDMKDAFGLKLWENGATNSGGIHGLETPTYVATRATFNHKATKPSASYAGYTTAPGNLGTWNTTTWPDGTGDPEYDWWSPIILGAKGTGFTGTHTWVASCQEILRYGILAIQRTTENLDMVCLSRDAYTRFLDTLDSIERIPTERGGGNSLLVKLGFGSVTNFDGVDITWEEGVDIADSNALGYGVVLNKCELCTPQDQLFRPAPIDFAMDNLTDRYLVRFWGQLKLNPRHILKITDTTAAA